MGKTQDLYVKARKFIPGGTQLLSKRPELFLPDHWPAYYKKAKGCEVWDLDDKKYVDMISMGIGACILGYADEDVNREVIRVVESGNMSSLNSPEEVELAELLCSLHPWAGMVRYSRTGGEAMAIAVRIARAYTKKEKVLFCGYHGWHDWYLAANLSNDTALDGHLLPGLSPNGVPRSLRGLSIPFNYNDVNEFKRLIAEHKGNVCAVILESVRNSIPSKEFITAVREITKEENIVFIVDEITSGWRLNVGGAHLIYNMEPDIAVFAKAMANGYPMSAVVGRSNIMSAAQDSFISSTYWTEKIGPTAALATIRKMQKYNIPEHLQKMGELIQKGWQLYADRHQLPIHVSGIYPLSHFSFEYKEPLVLKTLFTQEMLERGFLASTLYYASYAHKENHIGEYLEAVDQAFARISEVVKAGRPEVMLKGAVCHAGFKRLS